MKESFALAGLGSASIVLTAVIILELVPHYSPAPPLPAATLAAPATVSPHPAAIDRNDMVETLLSRPLFNPLRQPDHSDSAGKGASFVAGLPRLSGIMIWGMERQVIFQAAGADKPIVVPEGADIAGQRVKHIANGAVDMSGPEGIRTMAPEFDPNAKPAEPAMPPRIAAGPVAGSTPQRPAEAPARTPIDLRRGVPQAPPGGPLPSHPISQPNTANAPSGGRQ